MLNVVKDMPVRASDGVTLGVVDELDPKGGFTISRLDAGAHRPHRHVIPGAWIDRIDDVVHLKFANAELMLL